MDVAQQEALYVRELPVFRPPGDRRGVATGPRINTGRAWRAMKHVYKFVGRLKDSEDRDRGKKLIWVCLAGANGGGVEDYSNFMLATVEEQKKWLTPRNVKPLNSSRGTGYPEEGDRRAQVQRASNELRQLAAKLEHFADQREMKNALDDFDSAMDGMKTATDGEPGITLGTSWNNTFQDSSLSFCAPACSLMTLATTDGGDAGGMVDQAPVADDASVVDDAQGDDRVGHILEQLRSELSPDELQDLIARLSNDPSQEQPVSHAGDYQPVLMSTRSRGDNNPLAWAQERASRLGVGPPARALRGEMAALAVERAAKIRKAR